MSLRYTPLKLLAAYEIAKGALDALQLCIGATLHQLAACHHVDLIGPLDRAEPMGDHNPCGPKLLQVAGYHRLGMVIERAGGFVEDQEARPACHGARMDQSLGVLSGVSATRTSTGGPSARK